MLHAVGDRDRLFVAGVELSPIVELLLARDDELLDRVVGIIPVDEPQVVVADPEDVPLRNPLEFFTLRLPGILSISRMYRTLLTGVRRLGTDSITCCNTDSLTT